MLGKTLLGKPATGLGRPVPKAINGSSNAAAAFDYTGSFGEVDQ
jgi:hypothetical protein